MNQPVVGFAGMSHLGLVSAAAVAGVGFETVCFDTDPELIASLCHGALPIIEPDLAELIKANGARQRFASSASELGHCDVVYVALDVATDSEGRSDTSALKALIDSIIPAMHDEAAFVVLSQVEPGFTSALSLPPPVRRYYQVETLIFGRAVERATKPERYIVGCADPSRPLHPQLKKVLSAFKCPILPMRYESAELAKISINCYLVGALSMANMLAELCESIGADWSEIVPALKLDRRIGQFAYLAPGLGIAGGNLERDLATVRRLAAASDANVGLVEAWLRISRRRRDWAATAIQRALLDRKPGATIAVWGLAYKENTHSIKNSASVATIAQLNGVQIRVHDPAVAVSLIARPNVTGFTDPLLAVQGADALMILTPWPQYRQVAPTEIAQALSGKIVVDPYAVLDVAAAAEAGLAYYTLGRAPVVASG
jgi:UDPglucose 6-dehydrogenase